MSSIPHLLGMVHLLPLPGSPLHQGSLRQIVDRAVSDATALTGAGFPALIIENFGDVPFHRESVPAETVAAMTLAVTAVAEATGVPIGVNVLRNDAMSALGIASATGAVLVRVNVLTGLMYTDQGPIIGRAAEVIRKRNAIAAGVEVWADVHVKHAVAPVGATPGQMAIDTVERGLADAIIVSGSGTGLEPDLQELSVIRESVPKDTRLVVGSGASTQNLPELLEYADTVIVGSSLKADGDAHNQVDTLRASRFVETARANGLI